MKWRAFPITIKEARSYLSAWHRRRKGCHAARFAVAVECDGAVVGVAFCGNRIATMAPKNRRHLEVLRVATNGHANACTRIQACVDRVARAMGFELLFTYTDPEEGGASLRASNWQGPERTAGGTRGNRPGRNPEKQPPRWRWWRRIA